MQTFSTSGFADASNRLRYWREISSDIFAGIEVCPLWEDPFEGDLACADLGAMRLSHAASAPAEIDRPRARAARDSEELYFLHMQLVGQLGVEHCRREALVEEGDLVLCETGSPYRLTVTAPARTLILSIPGSALRACMPSPQEALGLRLDGRSGASALAGAFLQNLWSRSAELEQAPPEVVARLSGAFLDLFAAAVAQARGGSLAEAACARARRAEIRGLIEANLRDPGFGLAKLAAALGASERYVRKLFEDQEETIMERVLRRRLEECAKRLRDPIWRRRTATEIAFSWGFNSSSHFSSAFKKRFGVAPREYRRRALSETPPR